MGSQYARRFHMDRRRFLKSASGMPVAFLAMNQIDGQLFATDDSEDSGAERSNMAYGFVSGEI